MKQKNRCHQRRPGISSEIIPIVAEKGNFREWGSGSEDPLLLMEELLDASVGLMFAETGGSGTITPVMTKRQLGFLFIGIGAAAVVALLAVDVLGAGRFQGVGPVQRAALAGAAVLIVVGVTLLPLGDRPA